MRPFIPAWTLPEGGKHLALLVYILDDADEKHRLAGEPTYLQRAVRHPCGTPACAIGHLRDAYRDVFGFNSFLMVPRWQDYYELFSQWGCGNAITARQAADYIRHYIRREWRVELSPRLPRLPARLPYPYLRSRPHDYDGLI